MKILYPVSGRKNSSCSNLFEQIINELWREKAISDNARLSALENLPIKDSSDQFKEFFDVYISILSANIRWIVEIKGVHPKLLSLSRLIMEHGTENAITYFTILGKGEFGSTPRQVNMLVDHLNYLLKIDAALMWKFLTSYPALSKLLDSSSMADFISMAVSTFRKNRTDGIFFISGKNKNVSDFITLHTNGCRLSEVKSNLENLLLALTGQCIKIVDINHANAKKFPDNSFAAICTHDKFYLPGYVQKSNNKKSSHDEYKFLTIMAAGIYTESSFSRIMNYAELEKVLPHDNAIMRNLVLITEYVRIIHGIKEKWPGAERLIDCIIKKETQKYHVFNTKGHIFFDLLNLQKQATPLVRRIDAIAASSENIFDTSRKLNDMEKDDIIVLHPEIQEDQLCVLKFLPGFFDPKINEHIEPIDTYEHENPEVDEKFEEVFTKTPSKEDDLISVSHENSHDHDLEENDGDKVVTYYKYNEWSHTDNEYKTDFCKVLENQAETEEQSELPHLWNIEITNIKKTFDIIRPKILKKEKYCEEGDIINPELLIDYLITRRKELSPKIRFYERGRVRRRSLAVQILIDLSKSTGNMVGDDLVIDIEKHAALLLGEGVNTLNDRFSICGFSSQGPKKCMYVIYKDFYEKWDNKTKKKILSAKPMNSTRIGPALRHCGYRLSQLESRQKLIILITDGMPIDAGYSAITQYAQYDVRMACEENKRLSISTLGISMQESSDGDMELMFPQKRYFILPDITDLPKLLPKLYLQLTV